VKSRRLLYLTLVLTTLVPGCSKKPKEATTTPLHRAASDGKIERVKSLISSGADVNAKDDWDGGTPLQIAVQQGYKDIAEVLIAAGANVNSKNNEGMTPLHKAFFGAHKDIIELLVSSGADVTARDKGDRTPLHEAVGGDFHYSAEEILKAKYSNESPNGEKIGPSWDECEELAQSIKIEIVKLLISKGANINARDYLGGTALYEAIYFASVDLIKILLENGANPNVQDEFGEILLYEVVSSGFADVLKLLIDYGADVNMVDADGQTPLHEAAWNDQKEAAQLIISRGADVNAADRNGDTPLHVAALNGYDEFFDLLVTNSADINAKNKQGKTPVDYMNSPAPRDAIILSEDESKPYSIIITNLKNIRQFLKSEMIDFDQIWIPDKGDLEDLIPALKTCLEDKTPVPTKPWFESGYVLKHLDGYDREYAGFLKDGATYIICNLSLGTNWDPKRNVFTSVFDGGCNFVRVVFEQNTKKVILINCNGR